MKPCWICIVAAFLLFGCTKDAVSNRKDSVYTDPAAGIAERVDDLLARMSLAEKIGQMTQAERQALARIEDINTYYLGSLLSGGGSTPIDNSLSGWAEMYDRYQTQALKTRLKIPFIYGIDAVHGHNNLYGAVIFPHNIGLGCTGNPDLVEQAAAITALEVAATGIDWTFSPCLAVPQDERWGRTYEGFSESPAIVSMMAAAAVSGYQGDRLDDSETILACAKHFIGDGGTVYGVDQGNTIVDEQTLRDIHLPGYLAAIEQNVGSIMASFNSWNGNKVHGSYYLLTTVLKEELGFDGFIVSDWGAVDQISGDYSQAVESAINAGIDMVMVPNNYQGFIATLTSLVNEGRVSQERIDDAVRRILAKKFELGLFEYPMTDLDLSGFVGSPAHRDVARQCVRESIVLLKNNNSILPLDINTDKIYIAGKADDLGIQCGGWSITWQGSTGPITVGTTIYEAVQAAIGTGTHFEFINGSSTVTSDSPVIVVIGEEPYAEGAGDRWDLNFSQSDIDLVNGLHDKGLDVIAVVLSGRPLILDPIINKCQAILAAWLPGTEGQGVTDILFGDFSPTGKLSNSWPRSNDQVPVNFGDPVYSPLFEFGFGLEY